MHRIEIESLAEFDRLADGARSMAGWQIQGVDLTDRTEMLGRLAAHGALFLGGRLGPGVAADLRARGALVFPAIPDLPFNPYRGRLYTPAELYDGLADGYEYTLDAKAYAWHERANPRGAGGCTMHDSLAMALHDNSIDDAIAEWIDDRRIVGVMGGHAVTRDGATYLAAARLGQHLAAAGLTVATGGGPGAMEAANLGAICPTVDIGPAVAELARVPTFRPSVSRWARTAMSLDLPDSGLSLGIPTWFYGHEPPNVFCSAIAKFFRNALREDTLLQICTAGIVFLPGAAGTVQEIFQDACENYYAPAEQIAPMVLVGTDYWTRTLPAWQLLLALAADGPFARRIRLVDSPEEALGLLGDEG